MKPFDPYDRAAQLCAAAPEPDDTTLETLAACMATAWLMRHGRDPFDRRRVEDVADAILRTLDRFRRSVD